MAKEVKEIKLTQRGYDRLKAKLDERIKVRRPEILERIKEARAQGDLSENAEYSQALEDQGFNEGAIEKLENTLKRATIIQVDPNSEVVSLGCSVILEDVQLNDVRLYQIVGTEEADAFEDLISNECPVGNAIIGHKVGETVLVDTPDGKLEYRIVSF